MQLRSSSPKAVMSHVLEIVMAQPKDGPLAKALEDAGYDKIQDVLAMSQDDIDDLMMDQLDNDNNLT